MKFSNRKPLLLPTLLFLAFLIPHSSSLLLAQHDALCQDYYRKAKTAFEHKTYTHARDYIEVALPLCTEHADSLRALLKTIKATIEKQTQLVQDNADASHNASLALQIMDYDHLLAMRIAEFNLKAHPGNTNAAAAFRITAKLENQFYLHSPDGQMADVKALAWSPDGKWLATSSDGNKVKVWDMESRTAQFSLEGHSAEVSSIEWSPDGQYLASEAIDKTIKVWDVKNRRLLFDTVGHENGIAAIAWPPDGRHLADAPDDKTEEVWKLHSDLGNNAAKLTLSDLLRAGTRLRLSDMATLTAPEDLALAAAQLEEKQQWDQALYFYKKAFATSSTDKLREKVQELSKKADEDFDLEAYLKANQGKK